MEASSHNGSRLEQPIAYQSSQAFDSPNRRITPRPPRPSLSEPSSLVPPDLGAADAMLADLERERRREKHVLRWAAGAAFLVHGVLLSITFPSLGSTPREFTRDTTVYVLQQPRFRPPPPQGQTKPPEKRKKKIPIPDPTPDDPEPIVDPEIEIPEIELPDFGVADLGIPDAPAGGPGAFADGEGPYNIGGNIQPPVKIFDPAPGYTEEARMARIQGVVLLQAVLDPRGNVTRLRVLRGLPLGLTESALETVATWRYKPATRKGQPVAVYLHLAINFSIQ